MIAMKMIFRIGMLVLAAATFSGVAAAGFADCRCVLRQGVRIHGPAEFSCRVERFEGVENLKLRIFVRGVEYSREPEEIRALEEKLRKLLEGAEILELSNIRDRGYFRLLADVKADGVDVKTYLEGKAKKVEKAESQTPENPESEAQDSKKIQNLYGSNIKTSAALGTTAAYAKAKARLSNRDVENLLGMTADLSGLNADTPLGEALEVWSRSLRPAIPLVVLWNDLQTNALLEPRTPIGASGFGQMPAGQALDLILRSVGVLAAERPVAVVEGAVVTIGTAQTLRPRFQNRVYSVTELTVPPVWISEMMMGMQSAGNVVYR